MVIFLTDKDQLAIKTIEQAHTGPALRAIEIERFIKFGVQRPQSDHCWGIDRQGKQCRHEHRKNRLTCSKHARSEQHAMELQRRWSVVDDQITRFWGDLNSKPVIQFGTVAWDSNMDLQTQEK